MKVIKKKTCWSDYYTQQAKNDKYPSRSVYKLKEIQKKYNFIKKKHRVLDLGCSPGSWLLYTAEMVGETGYVIGIDLKPVDLVLPKNVCIFTSNVVFFNKIFTEQIGIKFNSVISDMAPSTTGNKVVDNARSFELCSIALKLTNIVLTKGGSFICKIFHGNDLKKITNSVKKQFKKQVLFRPKSTRKNSREIYIIGLNKL